MASQNFRKLLVGYSYPVTLVNTGIVLAELETYKEQIKALGVNQLSLHTVKECLQETEWIAQHEHEWLIDCYRYLASQKFAKIPLTDCPIVPLEAENKPEFSCDIEKPVYFECDDDCSQILAAVPEGARLDLGILDRAFFLKIKDDEKLCSWMTETLRVRSFSANNYAVDVLTRFRSNYQQLPEDDFIATTVFLSQFSASGIDFSRIPILLADGRRLLFSEIEELPDIQFVVTPECLDPDSGWQHIWKTTSDRSHFLVLSDLYSNEVSRSLVRDNLVRFYPEPLRRNEEYFRNEYYDYLAPEWMNDCNCEVSECEAKAIVGFLREYQHDVGGWKYRHFSRRSGRHKLRLEDSRHASIIKSLKTLRWVPTSKGLRKPGETFLLKSSTKETLGDTVPYFQDKLPDEVIELLGFRTEATNEELVSILEQDSHNGEGSKDLAVQIYRTLASRPNLDQGIVHQLQTGNLIFIWADSAWVGVKDVIWKDRSEILGNDFCYLEKLYPGLKDFFVDTIGVNEDVDAEIFARRWLKLQAEAYRNAQEIETILTNIYREIRPICEMEKKARPDWWTEFTKEVKIWTQDKTFEALSKVYVPDDGDLKQIFQDENVSFAWRPAKDSFSDWEVLYRALGLEYLSESVESLLIDDDLDDLQTATEYLTDAAKILIVTWIKEDRYSFDRLVENRVIDIFLNTKEARVPSLNVRYRS